jgi:hypothetical protein
MKQAELGFGALMEGGVVARRSSSGSMLRFFVAQTGREAVQQRLWAVM